MNRPAAINTLIDVVVEELCRDENHIFLVELLQNGFVGFAKMSEKRLEQELVYRGLENRFLTEPYFEDNESQDELRSSIAELHLHVAKHSSN